MDERVTERWLSLEMSNLLKALVSAPVPLADVVSGDAPAARTRAGEAHAFDAEAAARLHARLPPLLRRKVRVPITFFTERDEPGSAYAQDAHAVEALRLLGRPIPATAPDGKVWLSLPLAHDIAREYPTLFQFAYL